MKPLFQTLVRGKYTFFSFLKKTYSVLFLLQHMNGLCFTAGLRYASLCGRWKREQVIPFSNDLLEELFGAVLCLCLLECGNAVGKPLPFLLRSPRFASHGLWVDKCAKGLLGRVSNVSGVLVWRDKHPPQYIFSRSLVRFFSDV